MYWSFASQLDIPGLYLREPHVPRKFYSNNCITNSLRERNHVLFPPEIPLPLPLLIPQASSITVRVLSGPMPPQFYTYPALPLSLSLPPPSWVRQPSLMMTGEHPPEGWGIQAGGVDEGFSGGNGRINTGRICSVWSSTGCKVNCPWWGAVTELWWFWKWGGMEKI